MREGPILQNQKPNQSLYIPRQDRYTPPHPVRSYIPETPLRGRRTQSIGLKLLSMETSETSRNLSSNVKNTKLLDVSWEDEEQQWFNKSNQSDKWLFKF